MISTLMRSASSCVSSRAATLMDLLAPNSACSVCAEAQAAALAAFKAPVRGSKSSQRKVEVIMLQDVPVQKLRAFQIAQVAPGNARNQLVPERKAVYAHHLNRQRYRDEIAAAARTHARQAVVVGEEELQQQRRDARMLKRLRSLKLEVEIMSDDNIFLKPFTVPDLCKEVLRVANIVLAPELVMVPHPFTKPGTQQVPLAVLDDNGQQVAVTLQLVPRQASAEQLHALRKAQGRSNEVRESGEASGATTSEAGSS